VEGLVDLDPEEWLKINPEDAKRFNIEDGQWVEVSSRRGKVKVKAQITSTLPEGVTSMTFHFAEAPTNELTNPALDPVAKIPETKVSAIKVEVVKE
jgi:predicted molibdopterin-dependent oxidoreductase YjgC